MVIGVPCAQHPVGKKKLEVDHIDGNRSNNHPDNIRLLCHNCNVAEWRRQRRNVLERCGNGLGEGEKSGGDATTMVREEVDYQQGSPEMQANEWYEPHFRNWLIAYLRVYGWIPKREAIAAGAEEVGCSIQAARRYLEKMTSFKGACKEHKNPPTKRKEIRPKQGHPLFVVEEPQPNQLELEQSQSKEDGEECPKNA
jgi:hypothetical protein